MHAIPIVSRAASAVLLGPLLALGACKSEQTSTSTAPPAQDRKAEISNEFSVAAEVVAVAPSERMLTLRREDGTQMDVIVAPSVRNFDQIAKGDSLRVHYKETLTAELRPAGDVLTPPQGEIMAARARPGEKPAGGLGVAASQRVKVESIDRTNQIVVFSQASGELIARRIQTPQGRDFVKKLKPGDVVQLVYVEAVALSIEEP
jgi:hypothetical protein